MDKGLYDKHYFVRSVPGVEIYYSVSTPKFSRLARMIFAAGHIGRDQARARTEKLVTDRLAGSPIWRGVSDQPRLLPALYLADRDNQSRTPSVEKATLTGSCT